MNAKFNGIILNSLSIKIYENSVCSGTGVNIKNEGAYAIMSLNFDDDQTCKVGYFNCHNGYYAHNIILKVYEKHDDDSIKPLSSYI